MIVSSLLLSYFFHIFISGANFPPIFTAELGSASFTFTTVRPGSVVIEGGMPQAVGDAFLQKVENGQTTLPVLAFTVNGRSATIPGESTFPWWAILAIVLGVCVLAVIVIVVVVLVRRNNNSKVTGSYYKFNDESDSAAGYTPLQQTNSTPSYSPPPAAAAPSNVVRLRLQHNVIDQGEGVIQGKQGDIAFTSPEEWSETTDWIWVKIGTQEGYVPRSYLVMM